MRPFTRIVLLTRAILLATVSQPLSAQQTATPVFPNSNMETDADRDGWPDGWPKAGTWETEADNHFIRLKSTVPDTMVMLFRQVPIPPGVKAFELSLRWRVTDLKVGAKPWFDARVIMDLKDATGNKTSPQPDPVYSNSDTKGGWQERSTRFLVPEGSLTLHLMPALFNVKQGTLDIDDVVLKPIDPTELIVRQKAAEAAAAKAIVPAEQARREQWPVKLRVQGRHIVTASGGKEVWLQGVNVPSLEWSATGEQVLKSTVVAIEEWKANVIRLPVKDDYWFGRKGLSDGGKAYRELVDHVIMLAANRGAYVVLDLHLYRAPRKEHLEFWTDAATRYRNHPAVLFDLLNEPHGISWETWRDGGFVGEKNKEGDEDTFLTPEEKQHNQHGFQSPGMQAMLDAVRATGAGNIVVVGGLDYAYDLEGIVNDFALTDKSGRGIVYSCHIYPWKKDWRKKLLAAAAIHPVLLGEVGADEKKMDFMPHEIQEDAATWVPDVLGLIQQQHLHWTGWSFHPGASPRMLLDWNYTPTPFWGQPAKDALSGKPFPPPTRLR